MGGQVGAKGRKQTLQADGDEQAKSETDHCADQPHEDGFEQDRPQDLPSRSTECAKQG